MHRIALHDALLIRGTCHTVHSYPPSATSYAPTVKPTWICPEACTAPQTKETSCSRAIPFEPKHPDAGVEPFGIQYLQCIRKPFARGIHPRRHRFSRTRGTCVPRSVGCLDRTRSDQ